MDNPCSVRPATEDDLEQVLEIERDSFPKPWQAEAFKTEMSRSYARFWVLTDDETDTKVLGYIVFWLQAEAVSLLTIAVRPTERGQGYAERMIREMVKCVTHDEYPKIILEVRESNQAARKLYQKMGFSEIASRKGFYEDGEAAIIYELKTSDVPDTVQ